MRGRNIVAGLAALTLSAAQPLPAPGPVNVLEYLRGADAETAAIAERLAEATDSMLCPLVHYPLDVSASMAAPGTSGSAPLEAEILGFYAERPQEERLFRERFGLPKLPLPPVMLMPVPEESAPDSLGSEPQSAAFVRRDSVFVNPGVFASSSDRQREETRAHELIHIYTDALIAGLGLPPLRTDDPTSRIKREGLAAYYQRRLWAEKTGQEEPHGFAINSLHVLAHEHLRGLSTPHGCRSYETAILYAVGGLYLAQRISLRGEREGVRDFFKSDLELRVSEPNLYKNLPNLLLPWEKSSSSAWAP